MFGGMRVGVLSAILALVGTSTPAYAGPIVFDFNSLADGASNNKIQTYMRDMIFQELGLLSAVTVTGAKADKNYTGDGFVVGPVSGNSVTALTLGNSDGGVPHLGTFDTYIHNSNADLITMTFSFPIYSVSFDYEIFPNGSCEDPSDTFPAKPKGKCSVWPDFTFKADTTTYLWAVGQDPSKSGYVGYTHSPQSGPNSLEKAPQLLAVSPVFFFPQGVTKLEFIDWPEQIGIDNLKINQVPEPASMLLLGVGLVGVVRRIRRHAKAA
jgi:hypothetical protein